MCSRKAVLVVNGVLDFESATSSVVTIGDGRGFLIAARNGQTYVITAAHCLPNLPPTHPYSYTHERSYRELLGPLGQAPTIGAECLFVDPIADLAVLCQPEGQQDIFVDAFEAYNEFVECRTALGIAKLPRGHLHAANAALSEAWLLTLEGQWERVTARTNEYGPLRSVTLIGTTHGNVDGTSGSPIVTTDGAVGVVSVGSESNGIRDKEQHGQPLLAGCLPVWLLADLEKK